MHHRTHASHLRRKKIHWARSRIFISSGKKKYLYPLTILWFLLALPKCVTNNLSGCRKVCGFYRCLHFLSPSNRMRFNWGRFVHMCDASKIVIPWTQIDAMPGIRIVHFVPITFGSDCFILSKLRLKQAVLWFSCLGKRYILMGKGEILIRL